MVIQLYGTKSILHVHCGIPMRRFRMCLYSMGPYGDWKKMVDKDRHIRQNSVGKPLEITSS